MSGAEAKRRWYDIIRRNSSVGSLSLIWHGNVKTYSVVDWIGFHSIVLIFVVICCDLLWYVVDLSWSVPGLCWSVVDMYVICRWYVVVCGWCVAACCWSVVVRGWSVVISGWHVAELWWPVVDLWLIGGDLWLICADLLQRYPWRCFHNDAVDTIM